MVLTASQAQEECSQARRQLEEATTRLQTMERERQRWEIVCVRVETGEGGAGKKGISCGSVPQ